MVVAGAGSKLGRKPREFMLIESPLDGDRMRDLNLLFLTVALLMFPVLVNVSAAQSRMEAGVFLDYLSISQTGTNNIGLGARFGYRIHHDVLLEAELAYDYGLNFHEAFVDLANGDIVAIENTSIGVTHGLIGPTLQPAHGHFRPFATLKAGFIDFRLSSSLLPDAGIVSSVFGLH